MLSFLRRRRTATLQAVSFCDSCSQVCTSVCRASAHYDRARDRALMAGFPR
ncbi:MAG TPA: hypothetical protein VF755_29680 [Catenuloplanes sp.]|jgi:hypothetical protein